MDRIFFVQMDVEQQADDVRLDADHQKLDYQNFIDDDEVTLHRRKKDTDVTDIPGPDARDDHMGVMDLESAGGTGRLAGGAARIPGSSAVT